MSKSQKIVELARKQYTESNPQPTWMAPQSNFDDQLENLEDDEIVMKWRVKAAVNTLEKYLFHLYPKKRYIRYKREKNAYVRVLAFHDASSTGLDVD
ncbi:hypothetical protein FQA39_LY06393 [Lamprigera yunnana]|nr:hypothetical protein FQA39_LY06393 [Lamprigera yunnana]